MSYSTLKIRQSLKALGLSDNEVRVFIFLLKHKKTTALVISRETMISFCSVEYALSSLVSRKIVVTKPHGDEDCFEAVSEKKFLNWIAKQEKKHHTIYQKAKQDIGCFFEMVEDSSWKPDLSYFEGKKGIREIYEDILKTGEDVYGWSDVEKKKEILGGDYVLDYSQRRIDAGIRSHAIKPHNILNAKEKIGENTNKEIKVLDNFSINGEVRMYGNKVALIKYDTKKPVGFVFEGEWIKHLFQSLFDSAWKN